MGSENGGALGVVFFSMAIIFIISLLVLNIADYSLYSYKKKCIASAIDFSVSAAVQENNVELSRKGYAAGIDEATGKPSTDNITIEKDIAERAFFSTLEANVGIKRADVIADTMIIIINPTSTSMNYIINNDTKDISGSVTEPSSLESIINTNSIQFWNSSLPDSELVYVNGNPKTNEFNKKPYYMVFIKNFEIDGLFKKRVATFISFKGSNIERGKGSGDY